MPHLFSRYYQAILVLLLFPSVPLLEIEFVNTQKVFAAECDPLAEECEDPPVENPTDNPAGGGGDSGKKSDETKFSTLTETQAELEAKHMRGYQSLYEMQAELFAECVAKLKSWDGSGVKTLAGICAEEKKEINEQGPQRLLLHDASAEQSPNNQSENWWEDVLNYWFGAEGGLLPELKKEYDKNLRTLSPPNEVGVDRDLIEKLEEWYGKVNNTDGNEFLRYHLVTKNELQPVPFKQGIVTISSCPNPSSPIFANQQCVETEWDKRTNQLDNQRAKLIQKIGKKEDLDEAAKKLIAWYAVDDADMLERYEITASASRNALQLDIQKLSFLVSLLKQLAKYSGTVAYQLDLSENTTGGMGIYGNFSSTNAGVDIAQITNLSGKENLTLSQTISKLSNIMLIIALAIMIPVIVYAGFLMVLSGYDYEQYERGNELLWKVLPWAVWACACRFLIAAWIHVLTEAFRPIASF